MPSDLEKRISSVQLTTAPSFEGHRVVATREIVTSETVFRIHVLTDPFAGLREARKTCLLELRKEAVKVNANAVIAVDLDVTQFSFGGASLLLLIANGTAVKIERVGE